MSLDEGRVLDMDEKAKWIEDQANTALQFSLESRAMLAGEAQATLNWLFAIIAGSGGYAAKLIADGTFDIRIGVPLVVACVLGFGFAVCLFWRALRTTDVIGPGNQPANLSKPRFVEKPLADMRMLEAENVQERIQLSRQHNHRVGDAINAARFGVALIPLVAALLGVGLSVLHTDLRSADHQTVDPASPALVDHPTP